MRLHTDGSSVDGTRNVTWPAPKNGNAVNFQGNNLLATRLKIICFVSLGLISCLATGASKLSFSPQYKAAAEVVSKGQEIKVTVKVGSQEATDIFTFETERKLRLAVDDFDFDGHKDFSVSHTDDGIGGWAITLSLICIAILQLIESSCRWRRSVAMSLSILSYRSKNER